MSTERAGKSYETQKQALAILHEAKKMGILNETIRAELVKIFYSDTKPKRKGGCAECAQREKAALELKAWLERCYWS